MSFQAQQGVNMHDQQHVTLRLLHTVMRANRVAATDLHPNVFATRSRCWPETCRFGCKKLQVCKCAILARLQVSGMLDHTIDLTINTVPWMQCTQEQSQTLGYLDKVRKEMLEDLTLHHNCHNCHNCCNCHFDCS